MAEISANGKPRMVATNSQKNPEEYISEHQIPERRVSGRIIIYRTERRKQWAIILSKRIKIIVDDKARYTDWSTRDDIKANLQVDLILLLDEFDYPPVTIDDVYKEVLEQAENFKKYAD